MGRHRDVGVGVLRLGVAIVLLVQLAVAQGHHGQPHSAAQPQGLIGCKFYANLCAAHEWCYDDFAFGKCLSRRGYADPADLVRTPLDPVHSRRLIRMLDEMQAEGIGWDSEFAQCRIRTELQALREQPAALQQREPRPWRTWYRREDDPCAAVWPGDGGGGDASQTQDQDDEENAGVWLTAEEAEPYAEPVADVSFDPPAGYAADGGYARESAINLPALPAAGWQKRQHPHQQKKEPLSPMERYQAQPQPHEHGQHSGHYFPEDLVEDMRHRLELRRMLATYEAANGEQQQQQQQQHQLRQANAQQLWKERQLQEQLQQFEQQQNRQRQPPSQAERSALYGIIHRQPHDVGTLEDVGGDDDGGAAMAAYAAEIEAQERMPNPFAGQRSNFREVAQEFNVPQVVIESVALDNLATAERSNELPIDQMVLSVAGEVENQDAAEARRHRQREEERRNRYVAQMFLEQERANQQQQVAENEVEEHHPHNIPATGTVYTEGGLVYVPEPDQAVERHPVPRKPTAKQQQQDTATLLNSMLGFTRHERLDVKKPGPQVVQPDDAAQQPTRKPENVTETPVKDDAVAPKSAAAEEQEEAARSLKDLFSPSKAKKILHPMNDHGPHSVDADYAYVRMRTPIESWSDGPRLVAALAENLNMRNYLTFSRVDRHEISFRVEENPQKRSAADVAQAINESRWRNNLNRRYGFTVMFAGVGDKTKLPLAVSVIRTDQNQTDVTYILTYILLGAGAAALLVVALAVVYVRRSESKRNKLGGLQAGLTNVATNSKDYQDLCRTRMAGKGGDGRIFGGCKEVNEKAMTSSHSSDSSWTEEPPTNMDISTGHMVLSYMEDHLKNKGRLQREWEALCRYEAEPSSRDAASKPEYATLNRPAAPLPFDHSRVVINHLANIDGLDYINASSITDHDPRSASYIAAQAPLPNTLAHFWQMVWEQGSIMIVSLCRLQEMGSIACARYWPEEGSEVYDIYEVHLVSEHNLCDEYLVRSFYLKNLRTGETRTVTQFHFMAWPAFGLPTATKTLLEFRRKVNKAFRGRSSPVIVHSSNGAGRTGAYILLDMVLGRMQKGAREIDIAATLEHLRDQRSELVATQQQFEFVLMAVAEEVHSILKALPPIPPSEKPTELREDEDNAADETKKLIDVSDTETTEKTKEGKPQNKK